MLGEVCDDSLSAALDSGLACAVVVVFFAFNYLGWVDGFRLGGTEIFKLVSVGGSSLDDGIPLRN